MNIVFLTLVDPGNLVEKGNIYSDLMNEFNNHGHEVYIIYPVERRNKKNTFVEVRNGINVIGVKSLNITKSNIIEKGLATLAIEKIFIRAINKHLKNIKIDLLLYSTPPITFSNVVDYIKKRDGSFAYLMLKDIFPQNAVDLQMIKKNSILHKYFLGIEKKLYNNSDYIGCMSQENKNYLIKNNNIDPEKLEVLPNAIKILENRRLTPDEKKLTRIKLGLPTEKIISIYGGNLGKPQGIEYIKQIIKRNESFTEHYILIVGSGTEYSNLENFILKEKIINTKLFPHMKKDKFEQLLQIADIGLIFLDSRFTIPNYPSRLLSYLQFKLPVIASTDIVTDIKNTIEIGKFGFWNNSVNSQDFFENIKKLLNIEIRNTFGENGYKFLLDNFDVTNACKTIIKHIENEENYV